MISKENSEHYSWGNNCSGWHLVNNPELSVIQELMPPGTEEVKHKHLKSQQFFFILKGIAKFEYEDKEEVIAAGSGIHFLPGTFHKIKNATQEDLEFSGVAASFTWRQSIRIIHQHTVVCAPTDHSTFRIMLTG